MLTIDPAEELVLEWPFNRAVCKKLMVFNPSKEKRVAFKLKTTTPRLFFVRPSMGLVAPGEKIVIDIFVHPIFNDLQAHRHKFLMQAADASGIHSSVHEFWKNIDSSAIWNTRIKVKLIDSKIQPLPKMLDASETIGEHQDKDVNDPLAKLLQQVNILEDEREQLVQDIEKITQMKELERKEMEMKLREQSKPSGFKWFCIILMFLVAFVAGYCANFYTSNLI